MKDTARTRRRSILIVDIVSSTALYEELGDVEAKRRVADCLAGLADQTTSHSGRVVKSMGDGLLCSFNDGKQAVWAAVGMGARGARQALKIRLGLHCGKVVEDGGDIFGDAVNTAARIVELAKPNEILLTRDVGDHLPPLMESMVRPVPPIEVKGKKEPLALLSIQFAELEALVGGEDSLEDDVGRTVVVERATTGSRRLVQLALAYEGNHVVLEPGANLTIGRDPDSGLRVSNPFVSRHHARIVHQQGKFVLEDTSSNGTFLVPQWQKKLHLLREKAILQGNGLIYLGADPDATASEPIRFQET